MTQTGHSTAGNAPRRRNWIPR